MYELPPYLADFLKQYPAVELKLNYLKAPEIYNAVLMNQADIGLVAYPDPHPNLIIQLFKKDRLVVILPAKHPWARLRRISLKRLHGQPFIALQAGFPMRKALDRIFKDAQIHVPVAHEFDNLELVKRTVEVGAGFSIVPRKTIMMELQGATLKQLEISEGPFEQPVGILTRKRAERSLAAQKLITALLSPHRQPSRSV